MATLSRLRNVAIFGPALQSMFFVAVTRLQVALEEFYLLLLIPLRWQVDQYERDNPGERVFDSRQYELHALAYQVPFALAIAATFAVPTALLSWPPRVPEDFASQLVTQVLFVAFVELLFMIVTVRTVWLGDFPLGVVLWPPLFAFSHEPVREALLSGALTGDAVFAFLYVTVFAIVFYVLYAGGTFRAFHRYKELFGPVTVWVFHVGVNVVIIVFKLQLFGFELRPV